MQIEIWQIDDLDYQYFVSYCFLFFYKLYIWYVAENI